MQTEKLTRLLSLTLFIVITTSLISSLFYKEQWLWLDEVLSYLLVSDPSITHMNAAVISGMDANPPLFPNLYWLLGQGISLNPLFLRAVSVVLFALTVTLFYRYTTRLIGNAVTNFFLITFIVALTYLNLTLATQVRTYALFLLIGWGYFVTMQRLSVSPGKATWLIGHYVVGVLLIFTHNFGLFYVAASGVFFAGLWGWSTQRAYRLVLATHGLIGLSWLVSWYPAFTIQTQAGKPHSWIPLPTVASFFRIVGELAPTLSSNLEYRPGLLVLPVLRFILIGGLFLYIVRPRLTQSFRVIQQDPAFMFYLLSGWIYLSVISLALVVSLVHTSVFLSRYLWPSHLLVIYQLVYAWYYVGTRWSVRSFASGRLLPLVAVYALLLWGFLFYQNKKGGVIFTGGILTYLPQLNPRYPVFFESAHYFLPIWFQDKTVNARYLLNWETASNPANVLNATVEYKILEAVRAHYHIPAILTDQRLFPSGPSHFYVIDEGNRYQIEEFIQKGRVKIIRQLPIALPGHRILECILQAPSK